jgi:hypothetical protein
LFNCTLYCPIANKTSKSGPNTLAAYKTSSGKAEKNVAPVSANGFGGKLSANGGNSTGGAAQLAGSAAFAGLSGLFAYILV